MIVTHVYRSYYPAIGGLERVVQRVAEEQAKLGHEVHVVTTTQGAGDRPKEEILNGVHVHRIGSLRLFYPELTLPTELPVDLLKRSDVVHIHSQNELLGARVASISRDLGTRIATSFMAVDSLKSHPNLIKRLLGCMVQSKLTEKFIKLSDMILVKSFRDLNILETEYNVNAIYVPDGIDREYLTKARDPEHFRSSYDIPWNDYVLYIGRLHPAKGPQVLIRSLYYILKEKDRGIGVVIIGPGDQKWLKKLASRLGVEDHVMLTGRVDEETKISAIDGSLCVVIPSLYDYVEVFSLVLSEAWARRKPAIASAIGELPYRIKDGVNGLLIPPNKPKALADAIIKIKTLDLKVENDLMTWDSIAGELCELYESSHDLGTLGGKQGRIS